MTHRGMSCKMAVDETNHKEEPTMRCYHHFCRSERESIWENELLGKLLHEIAKCIGWSVSTVSQELRRNRYAHSYRLFKARRHMKTGASIAGGIRCWSKSISKESCRLDHWSAIRSQLEHFEGDLVYSRNHKLYIVTLVAGHIWFLITGIVKAKKPTEVAQSMVPMLEVLPDRLLQSITLDRDNEFANHADITAKILNAQFYFAHPMCRWERGTNENANGQLRQYVLKDT